MELKIDLNGSITLYFGHLSFLKQRYHHVFVLRMTNDQNIAEIR